ncbi:hypothetical protein BU26DRAFT_522620 [Trematosphaeria pertusa]|uniref:Uncharacterized protein n=1 Tax=Trematosphaeria pertusa TaxID=390896 RepID=A0A6A6I5P9_9PLEO|nr:uncharacterized protein BU26DRAFT_522620 [Trematosphaeria pertusa]KAF2244890.1 hypothetical protein BU26DRAFT_522620 [Trematosphaeria pertusa]
MEVQSQKPTPTLEGMPVEVMSLILTSVKYKADNEDDEYVLGNGDLCNIRLVSRRVCQTSEDAFAQRFFISRKHMLSRTSLQALVDISRHPVFSNYVREVAIGPERVNAPVIAIFETFLTAFMGEVETEAWKAKFGPRQEKLILEQEEFDTSGQALDLLKVALEGFEHLTNIRLDSYPRSNNDGEWTRAWGAKTILEQLGEGQFNPLSWPDTCYALADEGGSGPKLHRHYDVVIQALQSIKCRKVWTIEVSLDSVDLCVEKEPFVITSREWHACKDRVRSIRLGGTTKDGPTIIGANWMDRLLRGCKNVESLTFTNECRIEPIIRQEWWANVTSLTLRDCRVRSFEFRNFLVKHSDTLEIIVCSGVSLTRWLMSSQFRTQPSSVKEIDPSWFIEFEVMRSMPRLQKLELSKLSWWIDYGVILPNHEEDVAKREAQGGSDRIMAEGSNIVVLLNRAIRDRTTVDKAPKVRVWFSEDKVRKDGCGVAEADSPP